MTARAWVNIGFHAGQISDRCRGYGVLRPGTLVFIVVTDVVVSAVGRHFFGIGRGLVRRENNDQHRSGRRNRSSFSPWVIGGRLIRREDKGPRRPSSSTFPPQIIGFESLYEERLLFAPVLRKPTLGEQLAQVFARFLFVHQSSRGGAPLGSDSGSSVSFVCWTFPGLPDIRIAFLFFLANSSGGSGANITGGLGCPPPPSPLSDLFIRGGRCLNIHVPALSEVVPDEPAHQFGFGALNFQAPVAEDGPEDGHLHALEPGLFQGAVEAGRGSAGTTGAARRRRWRWGSLAIFLGFGRAGDAVGSEVAFVFAHHRTHPSRLNPFSATAIGLPPDFDPRATFFLAAVRYRYDLCSVFRVAVRCPHILPLVESMKVLCIRGRRQGLRGIELNSRVHVGARRGKIAASPTRCVQSATYPFRISSRVYTALRLVAGAGGFCSPRFRWRGF
mmetsp:Transcript_44899/g.137113  ORF Transcript_44899/g.137113 Transcript_44899/m.137113 type:complete len:445 (-) Transcript_44899:540-1874(-)